MRVLLIGGGHSAYFAANSIKEIDPDGKLIIIEFTSEKVEVLSKTFPFAEVVQQEIDGVESYIKSNASILDAVIAATESDSLNLRYCRVARENAIPLIIAILNNPMNKEIFLKEGVRYIINPYGIIPVELSEILGSATNIIYKIPSGSVMMASLKVENEDELRKLRRKLRGSDDVSALLVSTSGEIKSSIEEADMRGRLYLMGSEEKLKKILDSFRRRKK